MPPVTICTDNMSTSRLPTNLTSNLNINVTPSSISNLRCKNSFTSEPALNSSSILSEDFCREPFFKKSKLHNLQAVSALRRSTNAPLAESVSENTENITENSRQLPISNNQANTKVKSGTLVLVTPLRKPMERSRPKISLSPDALYTRLPSRCPSIVQVCRKNYEHYAVIRRTKHRLTEQPQFLNLRKSSVCLSDSRPTQFSVYLNGAEGKVFTFEASSPEVAREWVRVFSPVKSEQSSAELMQRFTPIRKPLAPMNNCAILEEEDESEDSSPSSPVPSSKPTYVVESQSNVSTTENTNSKHAIDFSISSMKFNFSSDGLSNQKVLRFPLPVNDTNRSSDDLATIFKTSSMPVLYEEDENVVSEE